MGTQRTYVFLGGVRHAHFYLVISPPPGGLSILVLNMLLGTEDFCRQCFLLRHSICEDLRAQVSFSAGCVHVPELRSVMRITHIFAKGALRNAAREQLCVAGVWVTAH